MGSLFVRIGRGLAAVDDGPLVGRFLKSKGCFPARGLNVADARPAQRLTGGTAFTVGEFSWSPDGRRIAFSATREPGLAATSTADIYVLDVHTKEVRKVVDAPGADTNRVWSPDGLQLAYQTFYGQDEYSYRNHYVAVVPAVGAGV